MNSMMLNLFHLRPAVIVCMLATASAAHALAEPRNATIIDTELTSESMRIFAMTDEHIAVDLGSGRTRSLSLENVLAIILNDAVSETSGRGGDVFTADLSPDRGVGQLLLADGQRYVGKLVADSDVSKDVVSWSHPSLGRLEFKLDDVRGLILPASDGDRSVPRHLPEPDLADAIVFRNGDELHGFIIAIGDPIVIELAADAEQDAGRIVELPKDRVASLSMISPTRPAEGMRLWLNDGTIMAVDSLVMPEEGNIEVTGRWHGSGTQTLHLPRRTLAAMLIDADRVTPLGALPMMSVDSPPTRYRVSEPRLLGQSPVLGIPRIEYRGPLTAHYALPARASRFAAEAVLPRESRAWGDFELILRIDGRTVDRHRLNADTPTASINTHVDGRELTIELREGESGPVQNHLILTRSLILRSP